MTAHAHEMEFAHQRLSHQYEDLEQQNESYIVGMWTFLVTEIMFFGALFLALTVYRSIYGPDFAVAHTALNVTLGLTNTFVLLTSSFFMAMGVRAATLAKRGQAQFWIALTILMACAFIVIKGFEYSAEFNEHHFPGENFAWAETAGTSPRRGGSVVPTPQEQAQIHGAMAQPYQTQPFVADAKQLFFSLYFVMTGLHGLHVFIGILILTTLLLMLRFNHPAVDDYMPIEMAGLYWHFVDIVWIFLFPFIYLIGKF